MSPAPGLQFDRVLDPLAQSYHITRFVEANGESPFRILISCILSLRTKDEVTYPATERLFARASDPAAMLKLRATTIEKLIYPAGFYRRKAAQILAISRILVDEHGGRVPDSLEELIAFPGVGRKTANLTITLGYGKPGICVDTHVHRISNRLGWVATRQPDATEHELRQLLPKRWWIPINEILVRHGQQVCKPISPICSSCIVRKECQRIGVAKSR